MAHGHANVPGKIDPASIGAVPASRTVNKKALSGDITLSASDVGALPITGGTLTGDLSSPRLMITDAKNLGYAPEAIPVLDYQGWICKRTPAELLNDLGAASKSELKAKQDIINFVRFTILGADEGQWQETPLDDGSTAYAYSVPVENLNAYDRVDVVISPESIADAAACGLFPYTESYNKRFVIYSAQKPAASLTARCEIIKGNGGNKAHGFVNVPGPSVADLTKKVEELSKTVALLDHAIFMVPFPVAELTDIGSAQSPTWDNFNPEQLIISGTTSAAFPGTYTAVFTPVEGYHWIDGTTAPKSVKWKIVQQGIDLS